MNIPDFMPSLRRGAGPTPKDGGCLVQVAGYLNDGVSWTDSTPCVHPMLRQVAIGVNDSVGHDARQGLLEFAPRLIGTNDDSFDVQEKLVQWCMMQGWEHVSGNRSYSYRRYLNATKIPTPKVGLPHVGMWDESDSFLHQTPMPDFLMARKYSIDIAGFLVRDVYERVDVIAIGDVIDSPPNWAFGGGFFAKENPERDDALIKILSDMIDEYDRIVGREVSGKTVTDEDWKRVREYMKADA